MTNSERARTWREQRTAAGKCHRCPNAAAGYFCDACRRETSEYFASKMQEARLGLELLSLMVTLAEGKCAVCGEVKRWFHPVAHRRCRSQMLKNAA